MSRTTLITLTACIAFALPAATAGADTWTQQLTVYNQTASNAQNCNQQLAPGRGCVVVSATSLNGGSTWTSTPWQEIAAARAGWNGADTWSSSNSAFDSPLAAQVQYTMPDGSVYTTWGNVTHDGLEGVANTGCSATAGQPSDYVCTPQMLDNGQATVVTSVIFQPPGQEQYASAGETCAGPTGFQDMLSCRDVAEWVPGSGLTFYNGGTSSVGLSTDQTIAGCNGGPGVYCIICPSIPVGGFCSYDLPVDGSNSINPGQLYANSAAPIDVQVVGVSWPGVTSASVLPPGAPTSGGGDTADAIVTGGLRQTHRPPRKARRKMARAYRRG